MNVCVPVWVAGLASVHMTLDLETLETHGTHMVRWDTSDTMSWDTWTPETPRTHGHIYVAHDQIGKNT